MRFGACVCAGRSATSGSTRRGGSALVWTGVWQEGQFWSVTESGEPHERQPEKNGACPPPLPPWMDAPHLPHRGSEPKLASPQLGHLFVDISLKFLWRLSDNGEPDGLLTTLIRAGRGGRAAPLEFKASGAR